MYENRKSKNDLSETGNEKLEKIINEEANGVRKYGVPEMGEFDSTPEERELLYELGGLIGLEPLDTDMDKDTTAFVLRREYQTPNAGLEIKIDFGVVIGDHIYRHGWLTVTDGGYGTWSSDNYEVYYNGIAILENRENEVILGLRSYRNLDIYKFDKNNGRFGFVERMKLEKE